MHSRNLHKSGYPISQLVESHPALGTFIVVKPDQSQTIDFSNSEAVKALNAALLSHYYQVTFWDLPSGYLCPPVPGRADYVHHIADLLAEGHHGETPEGKVVKGLDIGTGANLIYPILCARLYGWQMVGTDIDMTSIKSAKALLAANANITKQIKLRHQASPRDIFDGVLNKQDKFDFCMCNPPFHVSAEAAMAGSERKIKNLKSNKHKRQSPISVNKKNTLLNFAGQGNELWCKGGELKFVQTMIEQSQTYQRQVVWFTCLVSNKDNLKKIQRQLQGLALTDVKTVNMAQGQKISRFIAWRF